MKKKFPKKILIKKPVKTEKKSYDYNDNGWYYVTITTHNKEYLFGKVENETMIMNDFGKVISEEWLKSSQIRPEIQLGEFIIMPNHIHGIVMISTQNSTTPTLKTTHKQPLRTEKIKASPYKQKLDAFISGFKSATMNVINDMTNTQKKSIWERSYHEIIIRNKSDYERLKQYMLDNPKNWSRDIENIKK